MRAYEEIINFIAGGTNPKDIIEFQPSDEVKERVSELISKEKNENLSNDEKNELNHYFELEHLMRLTKAKARKFITNE